MKAENKSPRPIEDDATQPRHLLTVRGVGYRFVPGTTKMIAETKSPHPIEDHAAHPRHLLTVRRVGYRFVPGTTQ